MNTLIAIPTFNSDKVLLETVYSALKQTKKAGVLVIDNCSNDKTNYIIEKLLSKKYKNLFILKNTKNFGRVGNWNKCLDFFYNSDYQYIKFLFPGDLLELNCIEECEIVFKRYNDLAAIAFPYNFVDGENNFVSRIKSLSNKHLTTTELLELNFKKGGILGAIISHIYSKKAIKGFFFDENYISKLGFDIKITQNGSVYYLDKILATFVKENHKTFDFADSVFGYMEFSWIEIMELIKLKKENKISLKKFNSYEQAIIINTIKRMLRFANLKTILNSLFHHFFYVAFNFLRRYKNTPTLVRLRKVYYNNF